MQDDLPRLPCTPLAAMAPGDQLAVLATARRLLDPRLVGLEEAVAHYDSIQDAIADAAELHLQRAIHHARTPAEKEAIQAAIRALRHATETSLPAGGSPAGKAAAERASSRWQDRLAVLPGGKP